MQNENFERYKSAYDIEDYVKLSSESYSIVHIFLDKPELTVINKDAKVTLPDMISNIGGTVGIFLGLSALSILDLLISCIQRTKKSFSDRITLSSSSAAPELLMDQDPLRESSRLFCNSHYSLRKY